MINLYFKKIYPHAVESVLTVCDLFRAGNPPRIVPDEAQATYERRGIKKHARIDWNKPVKQVYDLIRGTNPAPGAWTLVGGEELGVFDCAKVSGDGISSRVMSVSDDGVEVLEATLSLDDFRDADEIFTSGNAQKIMHATQFEDRHLQYGPISRRARELYWDWSANTAAV